MARYKKQFWMEGYKTWDERQVGRSRKHSVEWKRKQHKMAVRAGYQPKPQTWKQRVREMERNRFTPHEMEEYHRWRKIGLSPKEARRQVGTTTSAVQRVRKTMHKPREPRGDVLKYLDPKHWLR